MRIDLIQNFPQKCTGCLACADVCPVNCIKPIESDRGFIIPEINSTKCINCEKCFSVCPIFHQQKNNEEKQLYAAYAMNKVVNNNSASGGIFALIANQLLDEGYYICGASFDKKLRLSHKIIHKKEELRGLLKSKYVQSNTEGIYNKIKELLKQGGKVFFCGTPCQVSALLNVIPCNQKENLITADILCHGVPSQKMFNDYIMSLEQKHKGQVENFSFRVKDNKYKHANGFSYDVINKDKRKKVQGIYADSSFYYAYKQSFILRESCYDCPYVEADRGGDITLGDFWGIEKYKFSGNTDKGCSMVLINTIKGKETFKKIKNQIVYKEFPVKLKISQSSSLQEKSKKPHYYNEIFQVWTNEGYDSCARKYFMGGTRLKYRFRFLLPFWVRRLMKKWK